MKDTGKSIKDAPAWPLSAKGVATLALSAALMAGAASCKKDKDASTTTGALGFRATVEAHSGDGKTHLDNSQVVWDLGDPVAVYNDNGDYGQFEAQNIGDGGKKADLMEDTDSYNYNGTYYAVYPDRSSMSFDKDSHKFLGLSLGQRQKFSSGGFDKGANPMAAYTQVADGSKETATLDFKNLCGLLKVTLKGSGWTVDSIRISAAASETAVAPTLWGTYDINIDTESANHTLSHTAGGDNTVILKGCNATLTESGTDFYFVLPPVSMPKGFTMEAFDNRGRVAFRKTVSDPISIEQSKITSMKPLEMNKPTDLAVYKGGYETANCYIATEPGKEYMFPCDVKGNGKDGEPTGTCTEWLSDDQRTSVLSGYKAAALVWQTYNDATTNPSDVVTGVRLVGDYVHFTRGTHEGNALIAVYSETGWNDNGSHKGDILWSWHIWCVNSEPAAVGTHKLMDRNLGALSTTPGDPLTAGLLYQWGRKDPLFGAANFMTQGSSVQTFMSSTLTAPAHQGVGDTIWAVDNGIRNLKRATMQPWRHVGYGDNGTSFDWFDDTPANSDGLWNESKTMFDPCPAGWRVAQNGAFGSGSELTPGASGGGWMYCGDETSASWGSKGLMFHGSYFPASGWRSSASGELSHVGSRGFSCSCSPYSATPRNAYILYFNSSEVYPEGNNHRAYGFPVRPVHE